MLVTALQAAERERDLAASREPTDSSSRAPHDKLQYDFPIVTPRELDALTRAIESDPDAHPITAPSSTPRSRAHPSPPTDDPKDPPPRAERSDARTSACARR